MPKSTVERQRERRQRLRNREADYNLYLRKDRERKQKRREDYDKDELSWHRLKQQEATRRWRQKKKETAAKNAQVPAQAAYASRQAFGKAKRRAEDSLPKSPRKKAAVVERLAFDVLKIKLPTAQARRRSTALSEETIDAVKAFYCSDMVSRVAPGKADFVTVWNVGSPKTRHQKRHMIMTIGETYAFFREEHPGHEIGKSKFAELRPKHVLLSSQMPHNVCGCIHHSNMILLLQALHRKCPEIPLYSREGFLPSCVCNTESEDCMASSCEVCSEGAVFRTNIVSKVRDRLGDALHWECWEEDDHGYLTKVTHQGTVADGLQRLSDRLPKFLWHVFVKNKQAAAYQEDKSLAQAEHSDVCLLQQDFAENYTAVSQDEIQSAHWRQRQISIYTMMHWHRQTTTSTIAVSDVRDHEKKAVACYTSKILEKIAESPTVRKVIIWTDGPSSQFKNRYIFALLAKLVAVFGLVIEWKYFATSHGKGPNDALGGTAKRTVHRVTMTRQCNVTNANTFAAALRSTDVAMGVMVLTAEDIEDTYKNLDLGSLWNQVPPITGIINTHHVTLSAPDLVECRYYSMAPEVRVHRVMPPGEDDILDDDDHANEDADNPADPLADHDVEHAMEHDIPGHQNKNPAHHSANNLADVSDPQLPLDHTRPTDRTADHPSDDLTLNSDQRVNGSDGDQSQGHGTQDPGAASNQARGVHGNPARGRVRGNPARGGVRGNPARRGVCGNQARGGVRSARRSNQTRNGSVSAARGHHQATAHFFCIVCSEAFVEPPTEDWIKCSLCSQWAHEACTDYTGRGLYVCDICKE